MHIYNRSDVVRSFIIGKYKKPNVTEYDLNEKLVARKLIFSDSLTYLSIKDDNAFIAEGRQIIVIRKCREACKVSSSQVFLILVEDCIKLLSFYSDATNTVQG